MAGIGRVSEVRGVENGIREVGKGQEGGGSWRHLEDIV